MKYQVLEARHVDGHVVWLRFEDGTMGELDLFQELYGEVFEPLREEEVFKTLFVHPELHTLAWPNGADLSPEFLYESVRHRA